MNLYKNNSELFDANELESSNFFENIGENPSVYDKYFDYKLAKTNVTLRVIRNLALDRGSVFQRILRKRLEEFYIIERNQFFDFSFELERYLNDVYYSEKTNKSLNGEDGKMLIKKI